MLHRSHESKTEIILGGLVGEEPGGGPGRHPAKRLAMPAKCYRKEVKRVVAMGPNPRQAINGGDDRQVPAERRRQTGNVWISEGKLVHQLVGALHDRGATLG